MRPVLPLLALLVMALPGTPEVGAQSVATPSAGSPLLDALTPAERVSGAPGSMAVRNRECRAFPMEVMRARIVDIAIREWAFFGFPVMDRANQLRLPPPGTRSALGIEPMSGAGRIPPVGAHEAGRVAPAIAGYWAVTPEGPGIVTEQNRRWNGSAGVAARWNAPWSAAFISWVMCEAGLGSTDQFRRAIAHWSYVDQAIRARDGREPGAAFVAYDIGEVGVEPGDLLCTSRQPAYRNLAERRRQMGSGARSHCDVVVKVDEERGQFLVIGGNVLRSVSLKVLPADRDSSGSLRPRSGSSNPLYAHLKLRGASIGTDGLARNPALHASLCPDGAPPEPRFRRAAELLGLDADPRSGC